MMEYPKLVVEVLSPSTQGYDRWHKSMLYYEVPTIEEIVLVDAERQLLAVHRREQNHFWTIHVFRQGETVHLASLDLNIPIETIYE
jgi:Uma2 family endonuclease